MQKMDAEGFEPSPLWVLVLEKSQIPPSKRAHPMAIESEHTSPHQRLTVSKRPCFLHMRPKHAMQRPGYCPV